MPEQQPVKQLLGFDFGLKQIGVASGQTLTNTATGIAILKAVDGTVQWAQVDQLLAQWKPDLLVVGLPLNMDGSESEIGRRARKFARRLHGRTGYKVVMIDERLSSREAKEMAREYSPRQDKTKIDHIAAALIAQSWLDDPSTAIDP